ncbi:MAG: serine/threonine-protein phosphatase [Phycisphaerales bacterium]|nr:serine/threonine-protein phosphatase [Phycisphaerales bacterium]
MAGTGSFETTEFRRAFHQETDLLLRQRVIMFIGIWGGLGLMSIAIGVTTLIMTAIESDKDVLQVLLQRQTLPTLVMAVVWTGVYVGALYAVLRLGLASKRMLQLSMLLIALDGITIVVMRAMGIPGAAVPIALFSHFIGCVLFPWTIRQAVIPLIVILGISTMSKLLIEGSSIGGATWALAFNIIFALPALGVCGFKHSQRVQKSTNRFLNQRYGMLRQELAYARQVHEALFPGPITTGPLQFSYRYEPMSQIGGDYLYTNHRHCKKTGSEQFSVVVLDVTGHGIPAALTVNRLHGEIDLQFAEREDVSPGEMLGVLNRYINLTLAKHSIYATAICLRIDMDRGVVQWASGGHPPAFVRGVDGTLRDLAPTAMVLGACDEEDYNPNEQEMEFAPGDSVIAYTDGAIEARDTAGAMLRIDGLRKIVASYGAESSGNDVQGLWSERILTQVGVHRGGLPPDDDTLIIEVFRPVQAAGSKRDDDPDSVLESIGAG